MRLAPGSASRREVLVVWLFCRVVSCCIYAEGLYIWCFQIEMNRDYQKSYLQVFRVPSRVWGRCLKFRDLVICGAVSATALGLA
jgi:hypothetical protein